MENGDYIKRNEIRMEDKLLKPKSLYKCIFFFIRLSQLTKTDTLNAWNKLNTWQKKNPLSCVYRRKQTHTLERIEEGLNRDKEATQEMTVEACLNGICLVK